MKRIILIVPLLFLLTGCTTKNEPTQKVTENTSSQSAAPTITQGVKMTLTRINQSEPKQKKIVTVTMDTGSVFKMNLYPDLAPETVANFIKKAQSGHYNGLTFHRVEDWVTQGGDPAGNGTGGGEIAAEYNDRTFKVGSVGIARGGDPNINNDSQFFITTKDSSFLDKNYTNFGDVTMGIEVVKAIKIGDKIKSITVE